MEITDDFIEEEVFKSIQQDLLGAFIWNYQDIVDIEGEREDTFQFCHSFIEGGVTQPWAFIDVLQPVLAKIDPLIFLRIKANILTKTPEVVENTFHVDHGDLSQEKLKQWTTSIFYMNTNNGYTEFEDGTKVESIENRMLTFPSNLKHRGTSCTDKKIRVVINFNYQKWF